MLRSILLLIILAFPGLSAYDKQSPLGGVADSQFLISVDKDSRILIDTKEEGIVKQGEFKVFKVFPGQHIIEAISLDGTGKFREIHRVQEGHQEIIEIKVLPSDESIGLIGEFIDQRDNQRYKTVKINGKIWLAENLKFNTFRSWCNGNNQNNCQKFGRLYHFDHVKASIPNGWHLPTKKDWEQLVALYKSETIIKDLSPGGKSNFNLSFGGYVFSRMSNNGIFESHNVNQTAEFWLDEQTVQNGSRENVTEAKFTHSGFSFDLAIARQHKAAYGSGLSVRCIKD